ncbi:MAG: hypothetical protein JW910_04550 [Anaerolineae bacterium]|nr:hypothetical protein [Anaerolineae bacterium]
MARTLEKLTEQDMQKLAEELVEMPFRKAARKARMMDPDVQVQQWRVAVGPEVRTKYNLPNLGVAVTLVEQFDSSPMQSHYDKQKVKEELIEARVEPLG